MSRKYLRSPRMTKPPFSGTLPVRGLAHLVPLNQIAVCGSKPALPEGRRSSTANPAASWRVLSGTPAALGLHRCQRSAGGIGVTASRPPFQVFRENSHCIRILFPPRTRRPSEGVKPAEPPIPLGLPPPEESRNGAGLLGVAFPASALGHGESACSGPGPRTVSGLIDRPSRHSGERSGRRRQLELLPSSKTRISPLPSKERIVFAWGRPEPLIFSQIWL